MVVLTTMLTVSQRLAGTDPESERMLYLYIDSYEELEQIGRFVNVTTLHIYLKHEAPPPAEFIAALNKLSHVMNFTTRGIVFQTFADVYDLIKEWPLTSLACDLDNPVDEYVGVLPPTLEHLTIEGNFSKSFIEAIAALPKLEKLELEVVSISLTANVNILNFKDVELNFLHDYVNFKPGNRIKYLAIAMQGGWTCATMAQNLVGNTTLTDLDILDEEAVYQDVLELSKSHGSVEIISLRRNETKFTKDQQKSILKAITRSQSLDVLPDIFDDRECCIIKEKYENMAAARTRRRDLYAFRAIDQSPAQPLLLLIASFLPNGEDIVRLHKWEEERRKQ